jgi:hypothetical protein
LLKNLRKIMFAGWGPVKLQEIAVVKRGLAVESLSSTTLTRLHTAQAFVASRNRRPHPSDFAPEQRDTLGKLEVQPKAYETDAEQACAATDEGRFVPRTGGGNPDIDNAAGNAGSLGDRPLVVLTAGRYWAPPGFEKEAAEYHEVWVHQLQASLARLSTHGRQVVVDAHHDMAEAPEAMVTAARQVVDEVRSRK